MLGPAGAGKTTLARILVGIERKDTGVVEVLGAPAERLDRRRVGFMPREEGLYADLDVASNVEAFGTLSGLDAVTVRRRLEGILGFVGLGAVPGTRVSDLSPSDRRRVSLACALVHEPEVLVLDEPTHDVDPVAREAIWSGLVLAARRGRRAVLATTSSAHEAALADRVVLLAAGTVVGQGTPASLVEASRAATLEDAFRALLTQGGAP